MTVSPEGLPAHARASGITTFGGHTNKRNKGNVGTVDPETDLSAEQFSRLVDIVRAAEKTIPFAVLTFSNNDASPAAPTINYYHRQYGAEPTVERISDGYVRITFASAYTDDYGVEESFSIRHLAADSHGIGSHIAKAAKESDQAILVRCINSTDGTAVADLDVTLRIW